MISKCANPDCATPLQYLREGKLYRIEVEQSAAASISRVAEQTKKKPARKVEHFWLCGRCSQSMDISLDENRLMRVLPKERPLYRRAVAS
jgi:hypothetical protein